MTRHQIDFDVRERVASNLRRLLAKRDLSLTALPGRSGVSHHTVKQIAHLETAVTVDVLARLAFALRVDVREFFVAIPQTGDS